MEPKDSIWSPNIRRILISLSQKLLFKMAIYLLAIPTSVLYAIALSGCVSESPGIPNIYLANIHESGTENEIRIGFFGLCYRPKNNTPFACLASPTGTPQEISTNLNAPTESITKALSLQTRILASPLVGSAILFLLSILLTAYDRYKKAALKEAKKTETSLPKTEEEEKKKEQPWWPRVFALLFAWMSTLLVFGAAFSATQALKGVEYVSDGEVEAEGVVMALSWFICLMGLGWSGGLSVVDIYENKESSEVMDRERRERKERKEELKKMERKGAGSGGERSKEASTTPAKFDMANMDNNSSSDANKEEG